MSVFEAIGRGVIVLAGLGVALAGLPAAAYLAQKGVWGTLAGVVSCLALIYVGMNTAGGPVPAPAAQFGGLVTATAAAIGLLWSAWRLALMTWVTFQGHDYKWGLAGVLMTLAPAGAAAWIGVAMYANGSEMIGLVSGFFGIIGIAAGVLIYRYFDKHGHEWLGGLLGAGLAMVGIWATVFLNQG